MSFKYSLSCTWAGLRAYATIQGGSLLIDGETYTATQSTPLTVGEVYGSNATPNGNHHNNSINIYGTGIQAVRIGNFDILTFHMVNSESPMLTLSIQRLELNFENVSLDFDFSDPVVLSDSVTLLSSTSAMTLSEAQLAKEWDIMNGDTKVATGTLALSDDKKPLKMNLTSTAPEPATATLSLLALAALASRRKRH